MRNNNLNKKLIAPNSNIKGHSPNSKNNLNKQYSSAHTKLKYKTLIKESNKNDPSTSSINFNQYQTPLTFTKDGKLNSKATASKSKQLSISPQPAGGPQFDTMNITEASVKRLKAPKHPTNAILKHKRFIREL